MTSAGAMGSRLARTLRFYETTLGKKVVMAVTGVILFGFIVSHMAGNLQVFAGPEAINHYAVSLRTMPALLWTARLVLLLAVILHIAASMQLARLRGEARPIGYVRKENVGSTYASRTMMWSGPIIAAFVVYHLLHFTWGTVHPDFRDLQPYENVVAGFRVIPVAIAYLVAVVLLGLHLRHGLWSMFQTVGIAHPGFTPKLKRAATIVAAAITLGFAAVPAGVLAGILR